MIQATLTTIATFGGTNGSNPAAGLIADAAGDLFGTTQYGANGDGTVFEIKANMGTIANNASITTVATFSGGDGSNPHAGLIGDSAGNLFGTTQYGGANGDGTVFEIKASNGTIASNASITTIATFSGANGSNPAAGLIADAAGDLFGTTQYDANGDGTVFEIKANKGTIASNASIITIATFSGGDGSNPHAGLIGDAAGNLFGTTQFGGANGDGTVFEIKASNGTIASNASITTIATFSGANGSNPSAGLITDAAGDLFGTTQYDANGDGTVFEIKANKGTIASNASITTVATFSGGDGSNPYAGLIGDAAGDLFGTTQYGGAIGDGTVFEIKASNGTIASNASITTVATFSGANGSNPLAGLIADAAGDLFGTTQYDAIGDGAVFEISNSGFVVACYAAGTRILTNQGEVVIERLAPGDVVATTLGRGLRPVGWIGQRHVDIARHPWPMAVRPILIAAGAFGPFLPARDLRVSPEHALYVDGMLVPARCLVNGASIRVDTDATTVTYYHIELDRHDVVLAEGLPAETWLDTGNRHMFANAGGAVALHADFAARAQAQPCAELVTDPARLTPLRRRLLAHATAVIRPARSGNDQDRLMSSTTR